MNPAEPAHIAVSKSTGVKIDWQDGHHSEYGLRYLRDNCPCASCSGTHTPASSPFQLYQPALKIAAVEPAGTYALVIQWSDGHRSGIYTYDHLRAICPCKECAPQAAEPRP